MATFSLCNSNICPLDWDMPQTDAWSEPRLVASAAVHKRPGARPGAVWYPVLCRGSSGSGRGKEGATGGGLLLLMYKVRKRAPLDSAVSSPVGLCCRHGAIPSAEPDSPWI